ASFVGYEPVTLTLSAAQAAQPITLTLKETSVRAQEVVISATRVSEAVMNSPVTVLKMSSREVQEAPGLNVFQNIPFVKGAEQVSSSLTFQIVNTRGFNSTNNTRFVQRMDGVEMQVPALNFPLGMLTNNNDLDIESVEIIPGPASALYGPNAFNGLLNIYTKDPFRYPGSSGYVRFGVNHIDGIDTTLRPLFDVSVRSAFAWRNRLGFKVVFSWFDGHDWIPSSTVDRGNYAGAAGAYAIPGAQNPGYDAVNRYGDEIRISPAQVRTIAGNLPIPPRDPNDLDFYLARTGYFERELTQYYARAFRTTVGLYYRITDKLQLSYTGMISTGATMYQSVNRYAFRDFLFHVNKLELSGPDFRFWVYGLGEDAGKTYDVRFAAINLLRRVKSDQNWMVQYVWNYTGQLHQLFTLRGWDPAAFGISPGGNHAESRAFADSDRGEAVAAYILANTPAGDPIRNIVPVLRGGARPAPGSPEFRRLLNEIIAQPNFAAGGAQFFDRSSLYHSEGQYDFSRLVRWVNLLAGGNFRYFLMNSKGTLFSDTAAPIGLWEYGVFLQASKNLWNDRLRLIGSLRYDKNQNFMGQINPRAGILFSIDPEKKHNLRFSYQTGFRMPTLQAQYIDLNLGVLKFIGGLRQSDTYYGIINNNYSWASVNEFLNAVQNRTRGTANPSAYADFLRTLPIENVKPEKVGVLEVGSRHLILDKIYIDLDYAYSRYQDFIGTIDLIGPIRYIRSDGSIFMGQLTPDSIASGRYVRYRRYYNSTNVVYTHNIGISFQYTISRRFFVNMNFNYADIILSEAAKKDALIAGFNTSRYRTSAYLTGRELLRNRRLSFTIGHRWVNAYFFQEPFHEQIIPTYQLVDAQVSYKFPKINTMLRVGGQNILNLRHIQVPGGPTLGALYYVQVLYDPFLP
ncbi:MAG: TonB-dependent receptor plug domain-containing protein, partial [Bacteroidia bacterium]|nr:TonB-dependent receptor plug domain-containing protein [Bacteroidia bacterium]